MGKSSDGTSAPPSEPEESSSGPHTSDVDVAVRCDPSSVYATLISARGATTRESVPPGAASSERFEDQGQVARGGMGTIHRVYDTVLCRVLAMKRMRRPLSEGPSLATLFVEEAQITSQLDHPNIVPVHDLGIDVDEGRAFFTMKLVNGRTLTEVLHEAHEESLSGRSLERLLGVFLKICDAVAFAHARSVVHRDLKPENVMVGSHGQVYVMDWGVALLLRGQRSAARSSERSGVAGADPDYEDSELWTKIEGTPAYMAPEQAWGDFDKIDQRCDVYGLGGILYEILTGRAPHLAEIPERSLALARSGDVPPPTDHGIWPDLPPGLCRITMKALEGDLTRRYQTVEQLKSEVEQFLMGGGWFQTRHFGAGDVIVKEGDPAYTAFIILRGDCEAFKTVNGQDVVLRRMGPGDVFGETAVLTAQVRTASVRALGRVELNVVTREALEHELGRHPWLQTFMKALAERFRDVDARLTELRKRLDDA